MTKHEKSILQKLEAQLWYDLNEREFEISLEFPRETFTSWIDYETNEKTHHKRVARLRSEWYGVHTAMELLKVPMDTDSEEYQQAFKFHNAVWKRFQK